MALIICPECQKQISSHATACPHCGYPVQEHLNSDLGAAAPLQQPQQKKSKKKLIVLLSILGCLILGAAGCVGYVLITHNSDTPTPTIQADGEQKVPSMEASEQETTIIPETTTTPETTTAPTQSSENIYDARAEYITALKDFVLLVEANCVLSVTACQKTTAVWSDMILEVDNPETALYTQTDGKFHYDVSTMLERLYSSQEMVESINLIKDTAAVISEDFRTLQTPPQGLESYLDEAKILYTEYCKLMNLAVYPSGNFINYTQNLGEYANTTSVQIKLLNTIIPNQ